VSWVAGSARVTSSPAPWSVTRWLTWSRGRPEPSLPPRSRWGTEGKWPGRRRPAPPGSSRGRDRERRSVAEARHPVLCAWALVADQSPHPEYSESAGCQSAAGGFMDVVEFQRLTARVVATRNSESRAFLQAFDRAPGPFSGGRSEPAPTGECGVATTMLFEEQSPSWRPSSTPKAPRRAEPSTAQSASPPSANSRSGRRAPGS